MTVQPKPELLIEVYTDVMCPWCWCGDAQLQKTLASDEFRHKVGPTMRPVVKLRPFLLDPRLPATSFEPPSERYDALELTDYQRGKPPTKKEYYSKKFTSLDAFDAKISKAAADVGLPRFEWLTDGKDDKYTPGIQERLASRLFKAFHHESQDMSDIHVLASLAAELDVFPDAGKAETWLRGDEGEYEIGQAMDMANMNGVQSIPFTVVQDGADHSSQVMGHNDLMRMFEMQAAMHQ